MSLSDADEQRLKELEANLAASDPKLVDDVSSTTIYTASVKNVKWAILVFVIGAVFMILTLSTSFLLSALGFVIMLGSALFLEKNLTKLGKSGISQVMKSTGNKGSMGGYINSVRSNMAKRFGKEENN